MGLVFVFQTYREYIRSHLALGLRYSKCLHVRYLESATSGKMVQISLYSFTAVYNTVRGQPVSRRPRAGYYRI